jgi:hypothetical protein
VDILHNRSVAPAFTIMTADKDDPRFDNFYLRGNEARLFIGLFLTEMPSYMGLGFELRDPHPTPFPNEFYTKLYVFHMDKGKNATQGSYKWGTNQPLFERLDRIRRFSEKIYDSIQRIDNQWLILPNASKKHKVAAWAIGDFLFIVNLDTENAVENLKIGTPQYKGDFDALNLQFSTFEETEHDFKTIKRTKSDIIFPKLEAGEGRVYKF